MSLQLDQTYAGILVADAYHKINYISGNKEKLHIDVVISKDSTEDAANNNIEAYSFVMEASDILHDDSAGDVNYTKQAYEFMKAAVFNDLANVEHDYTSAIDV